MSKKLKIHKVRDKTDSYYTIKNNNLFNIPFRMLINGASQRSGKTTAAINLILKNEGYNNDFEGDNIYIVSNNKLDNKIKILIEQKEIPSSNIMRFNEEMLNALYEVLEEDFEEAVQLGRKPPNVLILFDDCAYSNKLKDKTDGIVSKLIMNGRHANISQIYITQKLTLCSTALRSNVNSAILFQTTKKELEQIEQDFNYLKTKKQFMNMFHDVTKERNSFLVVDLNNDIEDMYLNRDFEIINSSQYL